MSGATAVVILAAGSGSRLGADRNKVLLPLAGIPLLAHSVRAAMAVPEVHRVVVVVRPGERDEVGEALQHHIGRHDIWLTDGGSERHHSEYAALRVLREDIETGEVDVVAIHDAARPLVTAEDFGQVVTAAREHGGAIPAVGPEPLHHADGSLPAEPLFAVQTPQAFSAAELLSAYDDAAAAGFVGTDTAACVAEFTDIKVRLLPGRPDNLKVTWATDLATAEALIGS